MAITAVTPVSGSQIVHGDTFSFTIDNTYTTLQVKVQASTALEKAYDTAMSGAQAGYTVTVTPVGGTDVFVISRDAGWDKSPTLIYVDEDESGSVVVTNISYTLASEQPFPQGTYPYTPIAPDVITSFIGRIGAVVAVAGDYDAFYYTEAEIDATVGAYLPLAGGQITGNITCAATETFDGRDLSEDGTRLDTMETAADVTDNANVTAAGALMDSEVDVNLKTFVLPASTTISAFGQTLIDDASASAARTTLGAGDVVGPASATIDMFAVFNGTTGKILKNSVWNGAMITANNAKVTADTANVTAAGALMDSEVSANLKTLTLPASTTISTFGATLVDDADAGTARTTLGVTTEAATDHGNILGLADDDHVRYVDIAGTRFQDAVRLTSRASPVNSPAVGETEIWSRSATYYDELIHSDRYGSQWQLAKCSGPTSGTIPYWDVSAGGDFCNTTQNLTYGSGALQLEGASASLVVGERTAAPTHAATQGMFWVLDDAPSEAMYTDDTGKDAYLATKELRYHFNFELSGVQNYWYSWNNYGPMYDVNLSDQADTTGSSLALGNVWENPGIFFPRNAEILDVSCEMSYNDTVTSANLDFYLVKMAVTNAMTTDATATVVAYWAPSTFTNAKKKYLSGSWTKSTPAINADDTLYLCFRRSTSSSVTINPYMTMVVRYKELV